MKGFSSILKKASKIVIDGREFVGTSVSIVNGKVTIDGVEQSGSLTGPVSVTVHGDVDRIDGPVASIEVSGSCGNVKTMSGDVRCGDVSGGVGTMSGDVTCGKIGGSVKSMSGDIRTR